MPLDVLTFAQLSADVYAPGASTKMAGEWVLQDLIVDDNFCARAYKHSTANLAVVAFRGTANLKDIVVADLCAIGLSLNVLALRFNSALDFTAKIKAQFGDVWLCGHSLGGAYVQLLAAICELPGYTFNAPGVLNLLQQMSPNVAIRLVGSVTGGAMSVLTLGTSDLLTKVASGMSNDPAQAILNYRGNMDPVSLIGVQVGAPARTIELLSQRPHPHSIEAIVGTLERKGLT